MLTLLLLGLVLRGCVLRPTTGIALERFNHGNNAAWLGIEWVNESHTEAEITALADGLQQRQIRTIFVYVSYLAPMERSKIPMPKPKLSCA